MTEHCKGKRRKERIESDIGALEGSVRTSPGRRILVGMGTTEQEPEEWLAASNTYSVKIVMVVLTVSNRLQLLWDSRLTVV